MKNNLKTKNLQEAIAISMSQLNFKNSNEIIDVKGGLPYTNFYTLLHELSNSDRPNKEKTSLVMQCLKGLNQEVSKEDMVAATREVTLRFLGYCPSLTTLEEVAHVLYSGTRMAVFLPNDVVRYISNPLSQLLPGQKVATIQRMRETKSTTNAKRLKAAMYASLDLQLTNLLEINKDNYTVKTMSEKSKGCNFNALLDEILREKQRLHKKHRKNGSGGLLHLADKSLKKNSIENISGSFLPLGA